MTSTETLRFLPPDLRDADIYGQWEWIYYPEKRVQPDRYAICPEGTIYDVVKKKQIKAFGMGEVRVKYAQVCDETGWPIKISLPKALLYTFVGGPPNGKPTTKIQYIDRDRENVTAGNLRWKV